MNPLDDSPTPAHDPGRTAGPKALAPSSSTSPSAVPEPRTGQASTPHFRAHPRKPARLEAVFSHRTQGWESEARLLNVGLGGAALELASDETVNVGDLVEIRLLSPALWDPLRLRARVAWFAAGHDERLPRAGLAFLFSSAEQALAVLELLETLPSES